MSEEDNLEIWIFILNFVFESKHLLWKSNAMYVKSLSL